MWKAIDELQVALEQVNPFVMSAVSAWIAQYLKEGAGEPPLYVIETALRQIKSLPTPQFLPESRTGWRKDPGIKDVVKLLARFYKKQTGLEPSFTVDPMNDNKVGGTFAEFLLAAVTKIALPTKGLVSQARKMRERKEI